MSGKLQYVAKTGSIPRPKGGFFMPAAHTKLHTEEDYYNIPEDIRAELIEGELIYNLASPTRFHQAILGELFSIIHQYIKSMGGPCHVYPAPFAVELNKIKRTIVEPDISVICNHNKLTNRGCTGAPDWIIEIVSSGNPSHDYVRKRDLYKKAGVREYWIVDPFKETVSVFLSDEGSSAEAAYTFQDKIPVHIYEDLSIDFSMLMASV